MPKEIEVTQAFKNKEIKCCLMVKHYAGREMGKVVHQTKEVVDDLIIRKVAIPKPVGYEIGDDEDSLQGNDSLETSTEERADADLDDVKTAGDSEAGAETEPEEVEDVFEEMSWNDLRAAGKEAGISLKGQNKESLKAALRAL